MQIECQSSGRCVPRIWLGIVASSPWAYRAVTRHLEETRPRKPASRACPHVGEADRHSSAFVLRHEWDVSVFYCIEFAELPDEQALQPAINRFLYESRRPLSLRVEHLELEFGVPLGLLNR